MGLLNFNNARLATKIFTIVGMLGLVAGIIAGVGIFALGSMNNAAHQLEVAAKQVAKGSDMEVMIMAINRAKPTLVAGERVTVDVVVRNQGVGHTFPGGTNDSNEGWLEFTVQNEAGVTLTISGFLDENGHLDPMAHAFKAVIVDRNGNPIHRRNAQDIFVTVYANVIGPGTADIAHYAFTVPPELAGQNLTLQARLLWRKFDRAYTEFAFQANPHGFKQFAETPDLPITEIAADQVNEAGAATGSVTERNAERTRQACPCAS